MFSQITPNIVNATELAYGGVSLRCQAGFFAGARVSGRSAFGLEGRFSKGSGEIPQARELNFHPEGVSIATEFPVCQPPKSLQLAISVPEIYDFYLYIDDSLFVLQKLLPDRLNVINKSAWGSLISPGGPEKSEIWLRLAFGRGQGNLAGSSRPRELFDAPAFSDSANNVLPPVAFGSHIYPRLAEPAISEEMAGELLGEAQRKIAEASHSETVRGGVQESEIGFVRSGGQFSPMKYDYDASWSFPLKIAFAEEKAPSWEGGGSFRTKRPLF